MKTYQVQQGDDLETIAYEHGVTPDRIWDLEDNEELREKRLDPCLLRAGDELTIPDPITNEWEIETETHHRFRMSGGTVDLNIAFTHDDEALADTPYSLTMVKKDGSELPEITGQTDGDGVLFRKIPIDVTEGEVALNPDTDDEQIVPFRLGEIDPSDEGYRGVQALLNNLGYDCGSEDDELGEKTRGAVRAFQEDHMLEPIADDADEIDEFTLEAIEAEYYLWLDDPDETYEDDEEDDETKAELDAEEEEDLEEAEIEDD